LLGVAGAAMLQGMRILVIQFDADKGLGLLQRPLQDLGCDLDVRLAPEGPLSLDGMDGLIVLGGLANPDDPDPAVAVARDLCAEALARTVPVLGVCLGAELLAAAAGSATPACEAEFGFRTVLLEPAAANDALLGELPDAFPVFEAHAYTWEPPAGSIVLARTELTRQAFHLPPVAWGVQFHFEADEPLLRHLASAEPTASVFAAHGVDLPEFLARAGDVTGAWVEGAESIARGFVRIVSASTSD
jgi:GMP synthase-like glutamine amidotransferase